MAHLYLSCLFRRSPYLWLEGIVSSSWLFAVAGADELVETGLEDGTRARGGRPRCLPRGLPRVLPCNLERVTRGEGAARAELPARPLGLPRGLPLGRVPRSALGR